MGNHTQAQARDLLFFARQPVVQLGFQHAIAKEPPPADYDAWSEQMQLFYELGRLTGAMPAARLGDLRSAERVASIMLLAVLTGAYPRSIAA